MRFHHRSLRGLALRACVGLAFLAALPVEAQPGRSGHLEKATFDLAAERATHAPGDTARLTALVTIESGWHIQANPASFDYLIPTVLELDLPAGWSPARISYPPAKMWKFAFEESPLAVYEGETRIAAEVEIPSTASGAAPLRARLRYQACDDRQCLAPVDTEVSLKLTIGAPEGGSTVTPPAAAQDVESTRSIATAPESGENGAGARANAGAPSLVLMIALALLGGLILNAMPCVLPILSLKVFGLVKSAGQSRAAVVGSGLATAAGILVSFWALALAAVAARAAGAAVGWGIQFQQPGFVAFLTVVVILFSLNLWGLFEVPLPARLARVAESGPHEGLHGHFASGLFATLMATPCSAPFLGTAVGFALAQEAGVILAIFTAVGIGMALPYLVLAAAPALARHLPRPGAWMDTLRGVMGFLLAGAAIWLLYVLAAQIEPDRLALVEGALLALGLATWLRHRAFGRSIQQRVAGVAVLLLAVATVALAAGGNGRPTAGAASPAAASDAGAIAWLTFDRLQAERLAAEGRLIFVDVTAEWCFTCKVNERLVLSTAEIAAAFREHQVIAMKADWTNRSDAIADYLASFGRYGIPFYALYRPGREPLILSELLTKESLLTALREGARPEPTQVLR